jgi:hypothetical protein
MYFRKLESDPLAYNLTIQTSTVANNYDSLTYSLSPNPPVTLQANNYNLDYVIRFQGITPNQWYRVSGPSLRNNHNVTNYYKIRVNLEQLGAGSVRVYFNNTLYYELTQGLTFYSIIDIYTQYGIAIDNYNGQMVPNNLNTGVFSLEPDEKVDIRVEVDSSLHQTTEV